MGAALASVTDEVYGERKREGGGPVDRIDIDVMLKEDAWTVSISIMSLSHGQITSFQGSKTTLSFALYNAFPSNLPPILAMVPP